ncbi:alpha/beta fold hydrolase [Nocardioides guangzhouensis]|uniref:Alpha/beta fold hydrolase n=1 Tax=Nocardioides guangzhouensis TaxID=2497878 RepID=A0A4Q4ZEM5_9ACTN|nr:alpha/beta fold hydrolase [Nocardioides guangzhouensis]RYP85684.1 alpha/beta fold hydrolase [Nocardioides guangzhouensis]
MPTSSPTAAWSAAAHPELTQSERPVGVLLLHGFTGSPASIRPWAEFLATRGYAVDVPLLPGHGTRWQDLNRTTWREWYDEAERGLDRLLVDNHRVVVGGLSMGAALALMLAAKRGPDVAGVISVNVSVDNRDWRRHLLPVLRRVTKSFPGIVDDIKKPGQTELGYDRLPLDASASLLDFYRALQPLLPQVTQPLLILCSSEDHVADPGSHRAVLESVSSIDVIEKVLPDSYHVATLDNDAPTIFEESVAFVHATTHAQHPE